MKTKTKISELREQMETAARELKKPKFAKEEKVLFWMFVFIFVVFAYFLTVINAENRGANKALQAIEEAQASEATVQPEPIIAEPIDQSRPEWTIIRPEIICHGDDPKQRYPIRQYQLQGKLQNWTCIPQYLVDDMERVSLEYNINVNSLAGLINTESAFNPDAVSKAGALGCAQFMPATWRDYSERGLFPDDWSVWNCEQAVEMAAIKLSRDGWSDSGWEQALYAYLGAGAKWYVERVKFWANLYANEEV